MNPLIFNTTLNVINRLLSQFNLEWDDGYLVYYVKLNYDTVKVDITPDFNDVLKILGLPKDIGLNIEYDSHQLATCQYFNWKVFKKNRHEIRPFLDCLRDFNYKSANSTKNKPNVIRSLKKSLNLDISYLIYSVVPAFYSKSDMRNKFNGHLIKDWLNLPKSNHSIEHIKSSFIEYVKTTDYPIFDYYLYNSSPKKVKYDFIDYYIKYCDLQNKH